MVLFGLLGEEGDMDETCPGIGAVEMMEQPVKHIVADKSAGGVGKSGRDAVRCDGFDHFPDGYCGKVGSGATWHHRHIDWLVSCVVLDACFLQVDGNNFRGYCPAATGLADT